MIPYRPNILTEVPRSLEKRLKLIDAIARHTAQENRASPINSAPPHASHACAGPTIRETYPELAALRQWLILKDSPDQPRVPAGNREGGQWAKGEDGSGSAALETGAMTDASNNVNSSQSTRTRDPRTQSAQLNIEGYDLTDNPEVNRVTRILFQALLRTHLLVGEGAGPMYGIRVHSVFAADIKSQNIPGIDGNGVEQSFSFGDVVRFGLDGSVRTDVVLRDETGKIIAVYDVKTGSARLSGARVREIRAQLKIGPEVKIFELHVARGIAAKIRLVEHTIGVLSLRAHMHIQRS
jgi:hypothetical protein